MMNLMKETQDEVNIDHNHAQRKEGAKEKLKDDIKDMEDRLFLLKGQDPGIVLSLSGYSSSLFKEILAEI